MEQQLKRRLIAGTINYYYPEDEYWINVHMDKSPRPLIDADGQSHPVDIVWDITEMTGSPENDYDEVKCHQTLEHIVPERVYLALQGFFRILKPGGVLDVETPDMDRIAEAWVNGEHDKEGLIRNVYGTQNAAMFPDADLMFHREGFWPSKMEAMLKEAGFEPGDLMQDGDSVQMRYRAVKPDPNAVTKKDIEEIPERIEKAGAAAGMVGDKGPEKAEVPAKTPVKKSPRKRGGKKS